LRATARGLNVVDPKMQIARANVETSPIDRLSARQREVMALAATGLDAPAIAESLSIAAVTVRQDLSKAYAILIPNPKPGTDLRTSAVLKYLKETRLYTDEFQI
jgi:DNA-binding NarL/FixJ family response regulator